MRAGRRRHGILAAVAAVAVAAALFLPTSPAPHADASTTPTGVTIAGLDAHDGTIVRDGGILYLYGTRYGCGFTWLATNTPFCGFGVWTATGLAGPWTFVRNLFPISDGDYAWGWQTWNWVCGNRGGGCFNPRMIRRGDGVWILYFNAPDDVRRGATTAYYAMGCVGPAGPCGDTAGGSGSTRRIPMGICRAPNNGDFSVVADGATAYLACSGSSISVEQLDGWWTTGTGSGVHDVAGLSAVETPGILRTAAGQWVLTFSDPNCGYCAGTATSYVMSDDGPAGHWTVAYNPGWAGQLAGRARISGSSCGGQPRTVFDVDGQPYEWIDTWYGSANETYAAIRLEPLTVTGPLNRSADGTPWPGGFAPFTCGG